jgi:hypothetical protein
VAPGTRCCSPWPAPTRRAAPVSRSASPPARTAPSSHTASSRSRCSSIPPRNARTLSEPIGWQCCHQVAARILNRIGERAERVGHVVWALRAAELRLALPFDDTTRERLGHDLRRVRARLN